MYVKYSHLFCITVDPFCYENNVTMEEIFIFLCKTLFLDYGTEYWTFLSSLHYAFVKLVLDL